MNSRSDQLFNKRKPQSAERMARGKANRQVSPRVLIVCEGMKTEPLYLKSLIGFLGLTTATVKISGEGGSAPVSVVNFGIKEFLKESDIESVFFVFDRDAHPSYVEALQKIKDHGKKKGMASKSFRAITSTPCFELWFLLHYTSSTKPYSEQGNRSVCDQLISDLKKLDGFSDYRKGKKSYFDLLKGWLDKAKKNAEFLLKQSQDVGEELHFGNPSTCMHQLIIELEKLKKVGKIHSKSENSKENLDQGGIA